MGPRAAGRRLLCGLSVLVVLGVGCEVLVDGELGLVRCDLEGADGPPSCPEGAVCKKGVCVEVERPLGTPCGMDHDCGPLDFCFDPSLIRGTRQKVCARPCRSSSDCDPHRDAVCWVPPEGGAGVCRVGRDVGRAEVGAGLVGERCASGGDCRSGMCSGDICVDFCSSDADCEATGTTCRFTTDLLPFGPAWACQPAGRSGKGRFESCREDDDCASGICADFGDGISLCTIPCCRSETCPVVLDGDTVKPVCTLIQSKGGETVRACTALRSAEDAGIAGDPCSADDECWGGVCVVQKPDDAEGVCRDVCCSDASCGDAPDGACRPASTSPSWALRCAPK